MFSTCCLFDILSVIGDGSVDFIPDYLMEVSSPDFDLATAKEWFALEDTNADGFVSRDELVNIATKVRTTFPYIACLIITSSLVL